MSRRTAFKLVSVENYLAAEAESPQKHEYVNGHVLAMPGSTEAHNLICSNLSRIISNYLESTGCRLYHNDMKVRVEATNSIYYPDMMVTCEPFDAKCVYKSSPTLLIELLSPSTMATDQREKKIAYLKISSLVEYLLVHQVRMQVELVHRISDDEWSTFGGTDEFVLRSLPNGELKLSVQSIYKGYNPTSRVKVEELEYETTL